METSRCTDAQTMKPIPAKTPTDTLMRALQEVEGAEHAIVILTFEGESRIKVIEDEQMTVKDESYLLTTVHHELLHLASEGNDE